jgi:ubiquinone/menaquinone biosynthesis C-methylase UbiE
MSFLRRLQYPIILKMLDLSPELLILDIGCGGGDLVCEVAKISRCVGVDLIGGRRKNIECTKNAEFIVADAEALPFEDKCFDKIILSSVLQMAGNDRRVLQEGCRVLKHNGTMVLCVPLDYLIIKRLYSFKGTIMNKIRKVLGLPPSYEELKKAFLTKFGSKGKGFYALNEIEDLLNQTEFKISCLEYSPKWWGTILYEIMLLFCQAVKLPFFHYRYDKVMYPLVYFDRLLNKRSPGCEIVISAIIKR